MKKLPAIIAALVTSGLILATMLAVGVNAYTKNVQAASTSGSPATALPSSLPADVQQLQDLVAQYQAREQQYKDLLSQAENNMTQVQTDLQQYENLFVQLQQMGVIRVDSGGQVTVMALRGEREFRDND